MVIYVPHLRNRTTNDSSSTATSVLTIDNFQSSDDGVYQCTAMNNGIMAPGSNATLTGKLCAHEVLPACTEWP